MRVRHLVFAFFLTLFFSASFILLAQEMNFASTGSDPLQIEADQGLELAQDNKTIIARGNAKAIRGKVTLTADTLIAHYRDAPKKETGASSSSEVWRVEAKGHVLIVTPTQRITAEFGDYNIDDAVAVLRGGNLKLVTENGELTARDSLEYWEKRGQAVARGDAVAIQGDRRLSAATLVADIGPDDKKKTAILRVRAYDDVVLTSAKEVVRGDSGDYVAKTGIATIVGAVKITRGGNQLNGGRAVVNLNTGISKLLPDAPDSGDRERVRGLFIPGNLEPRGSNPSGRTR